MNYKQLLRLITTMPKSKSLLIRGHLGIGKSALVKQAAAIMGRQLGEPVALVDIRLSQQDVGDLRGIPYMVGGNTFFAPPMWYPIEASYLEKQRSFLEASGHSYVPWQTHKHGIIFLDELNRATREVLQCSFELTLDHRLGGVPIPDGWLVVAAVNHDSKVYEIHKLDPAHINRFLVVDFSPDPDEWLGYASHRVAAGQMSPLVLEYIQANPHRLDPTEADLREASLSGTQVATRRSWTTLAEVLLETGVTSYSDDYTAMLVQACIGPLHMASFLAFAADSSKKTLSARMVLDGWSNKTAAELAALALAGKGHELSNLAASVLSEAVRRGELATSPPTVYNIQDFLDALPDELAVNCYRSWKKKDPEQSVKLYASTDITGARYPLKEKMLRAMSR